MNVALVELCELVRMTVQSGPETGVPGLAMVVGDVPESQLNALYQPMLNFVVQGKKSIHIGEHTVTYDPEHYFLISLDIPASGQVFHADRHLPYIALALTLNMDVVAELGSAMPLPASCAGSAFSVSPITAEMTDAWLRLARLTVKPDEVNVMAPLIEREILFRVMQGPQGKMLCQLARINSHLARLRDTLRWLRQHYDRPLRVEELASRTGMSVSAFHRYFKATTALSPIQYQKKIRLIEARKLLRGSRGDAGTTARAVGYESPSQFGREYRRMFGRTPKQDGKVTSP